MSKHYDPPWPRDYDLVKHGITQTALAALIHCPRLGLYVLNRWDSYAKLKTTGFGTIVHAALAAAYAARSPSAIPATIDQTERKLREEGADAERLQNAVAKASGLLAAYGEYYAEDFKGKKFVALEKPLLQVPGVWSEANLATLNAKIDGVYKNKEGETWLLETKTRSRIDEDALWSAVSFDWQSLFYLAAWNAANPKRQATGVLYNLIRTPQHKIRAGEKLRDFADRVQKEAEKNPEHFFKRREVIFSRKDHNWFWSELSQKLYAAEEIRLNPANRYHNQLACFGPYGPCTFLNACATGTTEGLYQKGKMFSEMYE